MNYSTKESHIKFNDIFQPNIWAARNDGVAAILNKAKDAERVELNASRSVAAAVSTRTSQ